MTVSSALTLIEANLSARIAAAEANPGQLSALDLNLLAAYYYSKAAGSGVPLGTVTVGGIGSSVDPAAVVNGGNGELIAQAKRTNIELAAIKNTGAATESTIAAVLNQLRGDRAIASQLFTDAASAIYLRVLVYNQETNAYESATLTLAGAPYTPTLPETTLSRSDLDTTETSWNIITAGTGYSIGDIVSQFNFLSQSPPAVVATLWFNQTTQLAIAAPLSGHRRRTDGLAATEATLATRALESGGNLAAILNSLNAQAKLTDSQPVIANAGTNLNTSALALETGGNLAALVAKDYATQATQTTIVTALGDILAELRDDTFVTSMLWEDRSAVVSIFYREERIKSQDDGSTTTIYTRLSDNAIIASLPGGSIPVAGATDRAIEYYRWKAKNTGTGYGAGDWIVNTLVADTDGAGAILSSTWYNLSTAAAIATPPGADLADPNDQLLAVVGAQSDAAQTNPATPATLLAYIKGGLVNWATFLARIPASLGAKLAVQSFSITLASDDAQLGTDVTGIAQSVGGTGGRGWLSEIVRVLRLSDPTDVALPTPAPGQSAAGNNLLLSVAGSDWLDLGANNNYSSLMVSLAASVVSGGTGQVVCEGTTDPVLGQAYSLNRTEGTGVASNQFTLTTNVVRAIEIFVPFRYVKVRLVTPPASGTVTVFQVLGRRKGSIAVTPTQSVGSSLVRVQDSTQSFTLPSADVAARALFARITDGTSQQAVKAASTAPVAADPAAVVSISPNSSVQLAPVSAAIADVTASAIAAVGVTTSAAIVPTWGVSQSFELVITAPSGAPVLDVVVQELIAGAWITVYAFPSVSTATTLSSNLIAQAGRQYRYQYTFSGTGSITRAVNRYQSNVFIAPYSGLARLGGISPAAADFLVGARAIRRIYASNTTAIALFIQYHNKAAALTTGDIPISGEIYSLPAVSGSNAGIALVSPSDLPASGLSYGGNTRVGVSSTRNTYTAAAMTGVNLNIEVTA
jgi:hypothetical protein